MLLLNDFQTSVRKALAEIEPDYTYLPGVIICGTHTPHDTEEYIAKVKGARINGYPFLGICFGHQLAAIEFARNVLGIKDATSEEFGKGTFVVKKRPQIRVGLYKGESWWSNYEVDRTLEEKMATELPDNMITVPYHPEYQSSKDKPHPILVDFIKKCREYKRRNETVAMPHST